MPNASTMDIGQPIKFIETIKLQETINQKSKKSKA